MTFEEHLANKLATDPEFRRHWEESEPAHRIIRAIVAARSRNGWSRWDLAKRMGTTPVAIAHAEETGDVTPDFLARFAQAIDGE